MPTVRSCGGMVSDGDFPTLTRCASVPTKTGSSAGVSLAVASRRRNGHASLLIASTKRWRPSRFHVTARAGIRGPA